MRFNIAEIEDFFLEKKPYDINKYESVMWPEISKERINMMLRNIMLIHDSLDGKPPRCEAKPPSSYDAIYYNWVPFFETNPPPLLIKAKEVLTFHKCSPYNFYRESLIEAFQQLQFEDLTNIYGISIYAANDIRQYVGLLEHRISVGKVTLWSRL